MRRKLIIIVAFALSLFVKATPTAMFEKANALYQQNEFAEAQLLYDSIVNSGYAHAETFYNLGNVHYRQGNVGLAVLNYERTLKINPEDEDAQHNLALANKQVVDEFNTVPTPALKRIFNDVSGIFSSSIWSYLGLFFFGLMLLWAILFLFVQRQTIFLSLLLMSFAIGLLVEGMAYGKYQLEQEQFAVLTAANSYVKSAPADTAEDLFILHEGTKVKVLDEFSGWQKIKLPDGKIGWINTNGLSVI